MFAEDLPSCAPSTTDIDTSSPNVEARAGQDVGTRKELDDKQAKHSSNPDTYQTAERAQLNTVPITGKTANDTRHNDIPDEIIEPYAVVYNTETNPKQPSGLSSSESDRSNAGARHLRESQNATFSNPMYGADNHEQATDGNRSDATGDVHRLRNPTDALRANPMYGRVHRQPATGRTGCSVPRKCWIIALAVCLLQAGLLVGTILGVYYSTGVQDNQSLISTQVYSNWSTIMATEPTGTTPANSTILDTTNSSNIATEPAGTTPASATFTDRTDSASLTNTDGQPYTSFWRPEYI
ncbi:Hypp3818 [Branchiostoma lanceolatum]|uniref:Hypp3818 protein n=1 Tax=Branchiostoma lanceolatum TaxID=7740 RepID=A0A8K0EYL7_BRALA|nr:Hypp3818 [Branchiostoma lanceolatum]